MLATSHLGGADHVPEIRAEVTAGGIARLAGVGRAAVSNWRRRHADFPKPVGGTAAGPSFDLLDVERWLRAQGKLGSVPLRERLWQQIEQDPDGAAVALRRLGAVLLLLRERPDLRAESAAADDRRLVRLLAAPAAEVLRERLGEGHPVPPPTPAETADCLPLLRTGVELAGELGPRQAFEFLMSRHLQSGPRQYTLTPAEPAELMAELAGPAALVLDPACGFGGLLRAVGGSAAVSGQEADPDLAALTALRLALHTDGPVRIRVGDSLRADAFPALAAAGATATATATAAATAAGAGAGAGTGPHAGADPYTGAGADAVLCHPPFNERNWGHDELAYDSRWEYGFPPRTESELAWVQHALAHVREGGTVVLLMPPAAASRRSGRRIRADLLRRGALRAVIALPAGVAPPYGIPLHLWVLRRPGAEPAAQRLLLVDTGAPAEAPDRDQERERPSWQSLRTTVLDAWRAFDRYGTVPDRPGVSRALQVVDLLDDDVDLTPARHLPQQAVGGGAVGLADVRDRLADAVRRTAELAPDAGSSRQPTHWPLTSVGELARAGALLMRSGGTGPADSADDGDAEPSETTAAGDVVVPVLGRGATPRVVEQADAGTALGRNHYLLRPDPAALDPWFLAGFLRGSANNRQASSFTTTATRLDVRRLQVPRLPLADQRLYGERFRTLAAFEDAMRLAGRLGEQLVQGLYDGLTDGSVAPD